MGRTIWHHRGELVTRGTRQRTSGRNRRAAIVGISVLGVLAVIGAQFPADAHPADAVKGAALAAGQPAASASTGQVPAGTAVAGASVFGVVPQVASLSLAVTFGQSEAAYNQTESEASSSTVDLGGLGILLANSPVCGQVLLTTERQPQPLSANSDDGPSTQSSAGNAGGVGTESVSVSSNPLQAQGSTSPLSASIDGLADVEATSTAAVQYTSGTEQKAVASTTGTLDLLGGLVQLGGLEWTASQESGATDQASAGFTIGSATIDALGVKETLPATDSTATVVSTVNQVLAPLGVTLVMPTETQGSGAAAVGPLEIRFQGSSLENALVGPVNTGWQTVAKILTGLEDGSTGACQSAQDLISQLSPSIETVVNLELGIAQGGGQLDFDMGGANAGTQAAPDFTDPFGSGTSPLGSSPSTGSIDSLGSGSSASSTVPAGSSSGPLGSVSTGALGTSVPSGSTAAPLTTPTTAAHSYQLAAATRCETTSPADSPDCWRGLATVAGATAAALGALLLVGDVVYSRRRPRRRPARVRTTR